MLFRSDVVWKGQDEKMTHATPVVATILGVRQVIFFTQSGLVSLATASGEPLWRYKFKYAVSTAASPVVAGDIVYCSAGYGVGSGAVRIAKQGSEWTSTELWRSSGNAICNHWSTPVYHKGYLYGMFSFKQYGSGPMKCVELATGKEMWAMAGYGPGNVIIADDTIVALSDAGMITLVEPNPQAYKEIARVKAVDGKCWSTPIVSDGKIYARSAKEGVCLDVKPKSQVASISR